MLYNYFVSPSNLVIDKLYLVYDFSGVRILYFREFDYDDSGCLLYTSPSPRD